MATAKMMLPCRALYGTSLLRPSHNRKAPTIANGSAIQGKSSPGDCAFSFTGAVYARAREDKRPNLARRARVWTVELITPRRRLELPRGNQRSAGLSPLQGETRIGRKNR